MCSAMNFNCIPRNEFTIFVLHVIPIINYLLIEATVCLKIKRVEESVKYRPRHSNRPFAHPHFRGV